MVIFICFTVNTDIRAYTMKKILIPQKNGVANVLVWPELLYQILMTRRERQNDGMAKVSTQITIASVRQSLRFKFRKRMAAGLLHQEPPGSTGVHLLVGMII